MLPFQRNDELVFGTPTTLQGDQIQGDLIADNYSFMENNIISFSTSSNDKQLGENPNLRSGKRRSKSRGEYDIRRVIMHRDIERKRRQEMSNPLRSCLPLEHNKGKSSACDEIQMAVDYIKQMQKNIQDLSICRDKLKKLCNLSSIKAVSPNGCDNLADCVMVNQILDRVEILISHSNSIKSSEFGLSRILAELQERELDVVSCVSTRTNGGFFHKIQIEVGENSSAVSKVVKYPSSLLQAKDISMLKDRMTNAIN